MKPDLEQLFEPSEQTKYLFFGGKGGVGKTTLSTAVATRCADQGHQTTVISTDPTVSLSVMLGQEIGGRDRTPIEIVPNLCGLNINPTDARGVFQQRLANLTAPSIGNTVGEWMGTPCMDEMAAFDQFVYFLEQPAGDVVVFDTAPTGKTLRELALPFDWAGFLQRQIEDGKQLAQAMQLDDHAFETLENDKRRYDHAMNILRNPATTVFTLVLTPERLPIEETASAMEGLARLGIPVQALVINQVIVPEVIEGNQFLSARAKVQTRYLEEIDRRFGHLLRVRLPLLDDDIADLPTLRALGDILYGDPTQEVAR